MKDFKVRCKWSKDRSFTSGKTYEYINGAIKTDDGSLIGKEWSDWNSVDEFNEWCGNCAQFELVSDKPQFTKADLKTGMWIELEDGRKGMVLLGTANGDVVSGKHTWFALDSITDDLVVQNDITNKNCNIAKVYNPDRNRDYFNFDSNHYKPLWQRPEIPKMTHKEIEDKLGFEFEYVGE